MADGGVASSTYTWASAEQARAMAGAAVENAARNAMRIISGETRNIRQVRLGRFTLFLAHLHGPPLWWFPMVGTKKAPGYREVMVGWLVDAYVIGVRWKKEEEQ